MAIESNRDPLVIGGGCTDPSEEKAPAFAPELITESRSFHYLFALGLSALTTLLAALTGLLVWLLVLLSTLMLATLAALLTLFVVLISHRNLLFVSDT